MLGHKQETILYRILSGKTIIRINESRLDVITPSLDLLYESCEIYNEFIENSDLMSKDELKTILLNRGIVKPEELEFLKTCGKIVENFQKDLFLEFDNPEKSQAIRSYISATRQDQERIINTISKYDTYTREGLANYAKSIFLISKTTYSGNAPYKFGKIKPIVVLAKMSEFNISPNTIRQISKNAQWSNLWFGFKGNNIFKGANSSIEQQLLMMWSRMYEGIKESPDCPKEEIVLDDDAIDGWLILEREERLNQKAKAANEKKFSHNSKLANAQEVFLIAKNKEDADRIHAQNSDYSNLVRQARLKTIQEKGVVNHHELPDIAQQLMLERAQKGIQNARGK